MSEATPDDDAAWRELRAALLDPATLVRAVASGRRRSGAPAWRRVELRPVSLAAGPRLQVTRYDERQAFTANHDWADAGPDGAAAVVDTLLGEPFGHWNVRTVTHDLRLRVTKRDRALLGREPEATGLAYWIGRMQNGATRLQIFDGFANSTEFAGLGNQKLAPHPILRKFGN